MRVTTGRRVVRAGEPLPVDINYDAEVVEGGVLHVYPDVYDREMNTVERLHEESRAAGVDEETKFDDRTLGRMIERASVSEKFVVRISDIKRSRAEPLIKSTSREKKKGKEKGRDNASDAQT